MKNFMNQIKNKLQDLFVSHSMIQEQPYEAFRLLLIAAIMSVLASVILGFVVFHVLITGSHLTATLNLLGLIAIVILLWRLHKTKEVGRIGHAMSMIMLCFFPAFNLINQGGDYSLIWTILAPFVFVALVGVKFGLRYLAIFYLILFSMAFMQIGVWDNGNWSLMGFLRLVIASFAGVALAVVMESANQGMNDKIREQRLKEFSYAQKLRRLSTVDALTELYNRHYMEEALQAKLQEFKSTELFLTFFILDIDHFKLYNDQYGHFSGDLALKNIAQIVHNYIKRKDDLVFRLGGEEFGGILVSDDPIETSHWIAELKNEVIKAKILHAEEAPEKYLTISIGIYSEKIKEIASIEHVYRVADKALYESKHQGRNTVSIIYPKNDAKGES